MKIRDGFISNSSSSAFIMIVDEKEHDKIVKGLHPYVAAVANAVMYRCVVLGKKVCTFAELTVQGDSYMWEDFDFKYEGGRPDDIESPYEAFDEVYVPAVRKLPKDKFYRMTIDG